MKNSITTDLIRGTKSTAKHVKGNKFAIVLSLFSLVLLGFLAYKHVIVPLRVMEQSNAEMAYSPQRRLPDIPPRIKALIQHEQVADEAETRQV